MQNEQRPGLHNPPETMCGIAGILKFEGDAKRPEFAKAIRGMTGLMQRRGPDDEGYFSSEDGRLDLGFRRLSILDLTEADLRPFRVGRDSLAPIAEIPLPVQPPRDEPPPPKKPGGPGGSR